MPLTCPKCKLMSPDDAERCDCGYDFKLGRLPAFRVYYRAMTDEELLRVATNAESLIPVARAELGEELRRRGKESLILPTEKARADLGPWWWPVMPDGESAKKVAMYGATAAFFLAALYAILAVISIFTHLSPPLDYVRPNAIVDALIFAFLGLMIRRKISRVAAVGTLVLYIGDSIYGAIQEGGIRVMAVLWTVIFLWAFISGVRGTFAYHPHQERRDIGHL